MSERRILVSMPYGSKTGVLDAGPMTIDFDRVLKEILRPAAPAGWSVFRFDEAAEPGEVAPQFIRILGEVAIAIFDITFANANVYYELGVRHPNAPSQRTMLVAQRGTRPAFNIGHHQVWFYDYTDSVSWPEFSAKLRSILSTVTADVRPEAAPGVALPPAPPAEEMLRQVERATNRSQLVALWNDWKGRKLSSVEPLLDLGAKLIGVGNAGAAVEVAKRAYQLEPGRNDVVRIYGWYLRRSGDLELGAQYLERAILLNPGDTEALGMLGGVYKRRGQWREALESYAKAATIDPGDIYILVNIGALEAILNPADASAGRATYRKVVMLVETRSAEQRDVWDHLALGEARLVIDGNPASAMTHYRAAVDKRDRSALQSAAEQLELFLRFGVTGPGATAVLGTVLTPALVPSNTSAAEGTVAGARETGVAIVHVSDLHFGFRHGPDGTVRAMHRFGEGIHNRLLHVDIVAEIKRLLAEGRPPGQIFLVASGDIGYEAREEEYVLARAFFDEVRKQTGLPQANLVVVPGNHDVNWVEAKGGRGVRRFNEYIFFLRKTLGKERFRETHPHVEFDPEEQRWPEASTLVGFYEHSEANLFFVGLNSCILETDSKHFGLVGRAQLEYLRQRLERVAPDCVRIAVLHHHVIPIDKQFEEVAGDAGFDLSVVRDFGIVETLLQRLGFDLVLHGHKHMPALRESALRTGRDPKQGVKRLIVSGAGSASVVSEELPPGLGNHLAVLRMRSRVRVKEKPFVEVEWRGLDYDATATWRTLESWLLVG